MKSAAYWFHGCSKLVQVAGFEALQGVENTSQMFTSCAALESIFASSAPTSVKSGSLMFSGCNRLVGGSGYVPKQTDTHSKLTYDGVLTDPARGTRRWLHGFAYADGELVITSSPAPEAGRELLAQGRHCANARYNAVGATPWHAARGSISRVTVARDMADFTEVHTNYWFYGMSQIASVAGLRNLRGVGEMQHTFNTCTGLTSLDLRGFDPGKLTSLYYTFSGCKALRTITADAGWKPPGPGLSGPGTFNGCTSLVGGNGTAYSSGAIAYTYMRIDKEGGRGVSDGRVDASTPATHARSTACAAGVDALADLTQDEPHANDVGNRNLSNIRDTDPLRLLQMLWQARILPFPHTLLYRLRLHASEAEHRAPLHRPP